MTNLTIKNLPDEVYQQLKKQAQKNHRSLNREVIMHLEKCLQYSTQDIEMDFKKDYRLREKTVGYNLTSKQLNTAIHEAIEQWLIQEKKPEWPAVVLEFQGVKNFPLFEKNRSKLNPPKEDPLS